MISPYLLTLVYRYVSAIVPLITIGASCIRPHYLDNITKWTNAIITLVRFTKRSQVTPAIIYQVFENSPKIVKVTLLETIELEQFNA